MNVLNSVPLPIAKRAVQPSDWYAAAQWRPFQPGVYEVNAIAVTADSCARRFAYFDGVDFKPAASTPETANEYRFCADYGQIHPITRFRGLAEEV